jgi:RNA polymerase sigma factor (sigma-70 family)
MGEHHSPSPEQPSLEHLAVAAQGGDDSALEALWQRFQPLVRRLLRSYSRLSIAEDLPGEAYVLFHRLVHLYDATRGVAFTHYCEQTLSQGLHSVVRREWRTLQRAAESKETGELSSAGDPDTGSWTEHEQQTGRTDADVAERVVLQLMLERLLRTLAPRQAYVFTRHALRGESFAEIAAALGCSAHAARELYYRARRRLREQM